MQPEIKPCPFCGSSATLQIDEYYGGVYIECINENCGAASGLSYTYNDGKSAQEKTIELWNKRI